MNYFEFASDSAREQFEHVIDRLDDQQKRDDEERQQRILDALDELKDAALIAFDDPNRSMARGLNHLDFLARELGVYEQWSKQ